MICLCRTHAFANVRAATLQEKNKAQADAEKAGIDLSLIDSNLALSYEERALRHESARELILALKETGVAPLRRCEDRARSI